MYPYDQGIVDGLRAAQGEEPSFFDRLKNVMWGQASQAELAREQSRQEAADREQKALQDVINWQNSGSGQGYGSTGGLVGTDVTTPSGGTFTTTNPGANL
jgi:hypothetical protein